MSLSDELTRGVSAHSAWKQRLTRAIDTGQDLSTPARVRLDNACDFGTWLYAADAATRASSFYPDVKALHATFHQEASKVLELALAGKKAEAGDAMRYGSGYSRASTELVTKITAWRSSL